MNGFKNAHAGIIAVLAMALVSINRRLPETRRLSTGITTLALAGIVLLVAAGGASAAQCGPNSVPYKPVCQCGDTVMGDYTFTVDLDCSAAPANQPGLYIGASGITIDGAGFTMTGNRNAAGACDESILSGAAAPPSDNNPAMHSGIANSGWPGNAGNWNGVVIKDLEIKEFCTGIALGDTVHRDVDFNEVTNCTIHDCGNSTQSTHGIHMTYTNYSTITENPIYNIQGSGHAAGCSGGGNGIFLFGNMGMNANDGNNNTITYNNLSYNTKSGFFTKHMCMYNNFSYNTALENGQGGITLRCMKSNHNDVVGNNATGNLRWGIYIGGEDNSVYNNTANETGDGTTVDGEGICLCRDTADNNRVRNNTACWNDGDGIRIISGAIGNTLYDNTFCFNGQVDGVDINDGGATGDNNMCDTAFNYNDASAILPNPCVFQCPCVEPNLVVTNKIEKWVVDYTSYTINYTICNLGGAASIAGLTAIYINGTPAYTDVLPELGIGACYTNPAFGPVPSYGPNDTIRLWADCTNTTTECSETDNNRTNIFGGADLIIEDYNHEWVDLSWKTYNVTYSVKNVGDRPTPEDAWVNFTDLGGDWSGCVDPDKIPAGLPVGATVGPRTRTFVMGDTDDWIEVWVNFNHTCPVKVWNVLQHDRDRRGVTYTGPCQECGDVDLSGGALAGPDAALLRNHIAYPAWFPIDCMWAADVICTGTLAGPDAVRLGNHIAYPAWFVLDCCEGCERW